MVRRRIFLVALACACDHASFSNTDPPVDAGDEDACWGFVCADALVVTDPDASLQPPDAIAPPSVPCDDAGACMPPPSICATAQWLEYFDNGACNDGGCAFDVAFHLCDFGCWDGGCVPYHGTAPSP